MNTYEHIDIYTTVSFVCNDPERPRLRPFTVVLDQQFQFNKVFDMSMNIVDQSIQYLISTDRLCL